MEESVRISTHALQRMLERGLRSRDIERALQLGEVIETYPDDRPYPSRLILVQLDDGPMHLVAARDEAGSCEIVITAYVPSLDRWEPGFRRRKSK